MHVYIYMHIYSAYRFLDRPIYIHTKTPIRDEGVPVWTVVSCRFLYDLMTLVVFWAAPHPPPPPRITSSHRRPGQTTVVSLACSPSHHSKPNKVLAGKQFHLISQRSLTPNATISATWWTRGREGEPWRGSERETGMGVERRPDLQLLWPVAKSISRVRGRNKRWEKRWRQRDRRVP